MAFHLGTARGVPRPLTPRPALGPVALEADICGVAVAGLRTVGSAADWVVSVVSSRVPALVRGLAYAAS